MSILSRGNRGLYCALLFLLASLTGYADEVNPVQFSMQLRDGSTLIGTPSNAKTLPLVAAFGKLQIPFVQICSIQVENDLETVRVRLRNGDRITGHFESDRVELKTLLGLVMVPLVEVTLWSVSPRPGRYAAILGFYSDARASRRAPLPLVNLNVPEGDNILNADILNRMRDIVDVDPDFLTYRGTGSLLIPETGEYRVDLGAGCKLKIDGREYALDISKRSSKVFRLAHGRHTVELWARNNGGQLYGAYLSIAAAATGEMIPVSCTENEIREFLKTPIGETLPAQVHDWKRIRLGD